MDFEGFVGQEVAALRDSCTGLFSVTRTIAHVLVWDGTLVHVYDTEIDGYKLLSHTAMTFSQWCDQYGEKPGDAHYCHFPSNQ